jgi:hypothetical protein
MADATSSKFTYLVDEVELSRKLGIDIVDHVRVITLSGLGVDQERFIKELGPTFAELPWDQYDLKLAQVRHLKNAFPDQAERLDRFHRGYHLGETDLSPVQDLIDRLNPTQREEFDVLEPFRRRSIAKFRLTPDGKGDWDVQRVKAQEFSQEDAGQDYRALKRIFEETPESTVSHPEMVKLFQALADVVGELEPGAKAIGLTLHQVSLVADWDTFGDNSPEGIHQDGADYIVSALVVNRQNVVGGESIVYGPDRKTEYLRIELQPGQGIFQEDKGSDLWHFVTPVKLATTSHTEEGMRDIIGFDIDVVK